MGKTNKKAGLGNGCPYYKKCGGCQLQNMTYDEQLSFKQANEIKLLGKFCHVSEIAGMEKPYHYRCKVQAAFGMRSGKIISGVYQSSTHNIVSVSNCMIENEKADEIITTIRKLMPEFKLSVFNDKTLKGFLRHVLVRYGYYTGQIMVVMVTGTKIFPSKNAFVEALLKAHPQITTVVQSVNNKFTPLVLGNTFETLYGKGYIEDKICDKVFRISPASFYQVNPVQTQLLYKTAIDSLELNGNETVIDTYCGTGTLGIIASEKAGRVIGVEQNASAVKDAKINADVNNISNIKFYKQDATEFMSELAETDFKVDAVIMDPPRAGSTREFINALATLSPQKVAYVSCNPETLARDLLMFSKKGYKIKKIKPIDMFPHTAHVETVVLLKK